MGNNGSKDDSERNNFIELHDWKISRVNNGLDEAEVADIISKLVSQRDQLIERTDHLSSLTRLAEKTIASADELAKQIETEAIQKAEAKVATIVAKAEEQAQQLRKENQRIQAEFKSTIDKLCRQLVSEPESFTQRIQSLWTESENRLSELEKSATPITIEVTETQADSPESPKLAENAASTATEARETITASSILPQLEGKPDERPVTDKDEPSKTEQHEVHSDPPTTPAWHDTSWH